jgi:hypothetical protein
MAKFYEYLMASLPAIQFGAKPPFSFERFIGIVRDKIPEKDLAIILRIGGQMPCEEKAGQKTFDSWLEFEVALRNELARIRASRKKTDAQKFLRFDGLSDPMLYHTAMHAHRILSLTESERFLDAQRWQKLEEFQFGHYFDLEALVVYALKLLILIRWDTIQKLDKEKALEQVLAGAA